MSLMAVRAVAGTSEAFVAGGGDVGRIWHSTDLESWDATETALTDAASFTSLALTRDSSTLFATGVLRSQLCSLLKIEGL